MKNYKLISWLLSNSHEKQSPQRFGRYAVMLLMLLTLGVGQMWATDYYLMKTNGSNKGTSQGKMTVSGSVASIEWTAASNPTGSKFYVATATAGSSSVDYLCGSLTFNESEQQLYLYGTSNYNDAVTLSCTQTGTYRFEFNTSTNKIRCFYPKTLLKPGKYIYFDAHNESNWKEASFAARFYFKYYDSNSDVANVWCAAKDTVENWVYYAEIPAGNYTGQVQMNRYSAVDGTYWNNANVITASSRTAVTQNCLVAPNSGWDGITLTWSTYAPPVKSIALSHNVSPSGGDGSKGNPYLVPTGTSVTVTATPTNIGDPDITTSYKWDDGSYGATNTKVINCSTGGTKYSTTVTCRNAISGTNSSTKSATVYYQAVSTPTITLNSVSPSSSIVAGNDITLVGERANSSNAISFQYTTDDGANWTDISPKTTSGTSPKTITWTVPDAHGATQTFKFRAKLAETSPIYSSKSDGVTVYNTKTIHVKNTNDWGTLYLYAWDGSGDITKAWPGNTGNDTNGGFSCTNVGGGLWWDVVITSRATNFIIHKNVDGNDNRTVDLSYSTYTHDRCVAMGTASGKKTLPNTAVSCLTDASVSTSSVTPTVNNQATIGGNVTGLGNDKVISYGYYYSSTNSSLAGNNLTGSTRVEVGTNKTSTGTYSKNQTGLTGGTTYYVIAYATNGNGTVYGSRQSFTTPYKVTLTNPTGGTFSSSGVKYVSSTLSVSITATTGYTFSSWSAVGCAMSSTSTTSGVTTATLTPSADNATLTANYTENSYSVSVSVSPAGTGSISSPTPVDGKITVKQVTGTSVTAAPATNYVFKNWTYSGGGLTSSSTTKTSTFKATTTGGSITANFADMWNVKGDQWDDWNTYNGMPYVSSNTFRTSFSLPAKTTYHFKVVKRADAGGADVWYGVDGGKTLTRASNSVTGLEAGGGGSEYITFTTDAAGTYTITYVYNANVGSMSVTVGYPTAYTVQFGSDGHGTVTATATSAGGSMTSGDYVASGDVVTFAQTPSTGYTLKGWYTTAGGSTSAGLNGDNELTINANKTVYAQYNAKTYAVTFDYSTNGGSKTSGENSYNATFDQNTITTPVVYKDGYCLDGWYTASSAGTKVIDASGNLQPNVTNWTGAGGAWKKDGTATVYAVYVAPDTIMLDPDPEVMNTFAAQHSGKDTLLLTPGFDCTPTGSWNISYQVGYSENHTLLVPQPSIKYGSTGVDTIKMPAEANTYEIISVLRTGTTRGSGTEVMRDTLNYVVEDLYTVKARRIVDGIDIEDAADWSGYPTSRPTTVNAPLEVKGYVLDHWELGVGIDTVPGVGTRTASYETKQIYAHNNGTVKLHYKPKPNTVYLFNTNNSGMYAATRTKLYDYGTGGYWHTASTTQKGAGSSGLIGDTVIATDFESPVWMASIGSTSTSFAFTSDKQNNVNEFYSYTASNGTKLPAHVIYRTDFNRALMMFVPVATDDEDYYIVNKNGTDGEAHYYRGFWVKRSPNVDSTGYYLHVYDKVDRATANHIQTLPLRLTQTGEGNTWELTVKMDLEANKTYGFKITKATGASTKTWYSNGGTMTSGNHTGWVLDGTTNNIGLTTTSAGDYTFHVFCKNFGTKAANAANATHVQGQLAVTVDYAAVSGDYRVIYSDATQTEVIASPSIHSVANGQDTVSFFIRKSSASRVMQIQKYTSSWADFGDPVDLSDIAKDSVYVIYLQQNEDANSIEVSGIDFYSGDFYIRTDCVDEHKWDYKQSLANHRMNPSDYGMADIQPVKFTHYYVHWISEGGNVKFVVANKYAPCVSDTLITDTYANVAGGNLPSDSDPNTDKGANVRFMYNKGTNTVTRAYLAGAQGDGYNANFLKVTTSGSKMGTTDATPSDIKNKTFTDEKNWIYQAAIKAKPGLTGKLTAEYNSNTQYFIGSSSEEEQLIGGTGDSWQQILMTYDFKVNRLICAWQPSGDSINGEVPINADVMVIRTGQNDAQQIIFKNNDAKLSEVKYIYGVIQLNYDDMVGHMYTWSLTAYEHCMYYISFPYDVLVNDIMAPGRMGTEWRLQRYNGAKRAKDGWFAGDGVTTFWEDVQSGDTLKAYEGYSLLLNRRLFNDGSSSVWQNKGAGSKLYLYFPSKDATTGVVANKTVDVTVPSHLCEKDTWFAQDYNIDGSLKPGARNHKVVDSHWNMIGTPLFEDHTASNVTTGPTIDGETLQYIYEWNPAGNRLGIKDALNTSFEFRTMYSYMAQYAGIIRFVGSAVNNVVAAKRATEKKNYTLNLELFNEDEFIGRTYIELRENAVDSFLLNEDVYMVKNGVNADLYTFAGAYEAGANVLTIDNHIIPVGIDVKAAGTYKFSMPDNFDGEVVLVDNYAQTRTNLMIEDYEIALPTGTIDDRFSLEINIKKVPTSIDGVSEDGSLKDGKAHKYIENDKMYILQNGLIYDAQGKRVK